MIPDAPEIIEAFLQNEVDLACRRNAFVMLCHCDVERAVLYLHQNIQQVPTWGETLQLAALELIRKVCRTNPMQKGVYIRIIFALLQSSAAAVVYESSNTLISLSNAPTAIRAAAQCFCQLLATQSDNNIKLILLDRLTELRKNHIQIMQELLMDMLRALSSPNMDIRRKTLALAMDLVTNRNVEDVIVVLKKELLRTQSATDVSSEVLYEYRQLLVHALHSTAVRFPDVAPTAVHVLTDFLGDSYGAATTDVIIFVKEITETIPSLRPVILAKLLEALPTIKIPVVLRGALWILGEYSDRPEQIKDSFTVRIRSVYDVHLQGTFLLFRPSPLSSNLPYAHTQPPHTTIYHRLCLCANAETKCPVCFGFVDNHGKRWTPSVYHCQNRRRREGGRREQTQTCCASGTGHGSRRWHLRHTSCSGQTRQRWLRGYHDQRTGTEVPHSQR